MKTEELNKIIQKAAITVSYSWPGAIEADDLQQELWVKILESPKYMDQMVTSDPALRMELLKRLGMQIAGRYVNDYELFSGNAFYGTVHVRNLLDAGLLTIARADLADMKETLTEFLDLHEAFDVMKRSSREYAEIIWNVYANGDSPETGADKRRAQRAVRSLTDLMNQAHRRRFAEYEEGPGTRKVISNEKARIISQRQYSGHGDNHNSFAQ